MSLRALLATTLLAAATLAGEPREDYSALLGRVVKDGGVDYPALKAERAVLDRYVASLEKADPGKTDAEKIAFWINAYNALTLQQVLDTWNGKKDFSVYHDVKDFWKKRTWTVAGRALSLDAIENRVLRGEFSEPRIHFALNCASRSCPVLLGRPYAAATLDEDLTRQARIFLADPFRNRFDVPRQDAEVSRIFDWYRADFEKGMERGSGGVPPLQLFLARYAGKEEIARSLRASPWSIGYLPYDWALNLAGSRPAADRGVHPVWFVLYLLAAGGLLLYGFHAFKLLRWRRDHGEAYRAELRAARLRSPLGRTRFPPVLVQVPVFNEPDVVERAVDAVARLDWPRDVLRIEILDDSTDGTCAVVDAAAARWRAAGAPVHVRRRPHRDGFKAGALAASLAANPAAEYVAVFDADFVPPPDFLRRALPLFDAPGRVACVQGRWEHLNRNQSFLTRAQAVGVDAHFRIQQFARAARGVFLNFNGTAGVWRSEAIADAGGWRADTLTEDLDLSYRAQLRGWRIVLDDELAVPAELPPTLGAFKSQQRRWACGSIQCARRLLGPIWRSGRPFAVKAEATVHLCIYSTSLAAVLLVFLLPLASVRLPLATAPLWAVFWTAALGPLAMNAAGQRAGGRLRAADIAACFFLGLGVCASNGLAVARGLFHPIRTFVRTPKQGRRATPPVDAPPRIEQGLAGFTGAALCFLAGSEPVGAVTYGLFCAAGYWGVSAWWWLSARRAVRA